MPPENGITARRPYDHSNARGDSTPWTEVDGGGGPRPEVFYRVAGTGAVITPPEMRAQLGAGAKLVESRERAAVTQRGVEASAREGRPDAGHDTLTPELHSRVSGATVRFGTT
jgi:hypothetical protein